MDSRKVKYFLAVAEERHLGRAAERLHMSQPPLTRQIQLLEEELGVTLFTRTARGMALTQAGEALMKDARHIQAMLEQAAERARRAGRGQEGRLDIGVYGSAMFDSVPRLLERFHQRHPQVRIVVHHAQTPAQVTALRQGRVLAVLERMRPREADIEEELVSREPLFVALHADDPLAVQAEVDILQLKDSPLLVQAAPSSQLLNVALELCRNSGFEPQIAQSTDDIVAATMMVAAGLGTCFVPRCMTRVQMPRLVYRPLTAPHAAHMSLYCYYLKQETSPLLNAFLAELREFAADEATI